MEFHPAVLEGFSEKIYKTTINLKDSTLTPGFFFEVLFNYNVENIKNASIKFYGIFKKDDSVVGYLKNPASFQKREDRIITNSLSFYNIQKKSGKSLALSSQSFFEVSLEQNYGKDDLLAEFWIKIDNQSTSF